MKKCPECGNELPDNALECNQCGYPFEEDSNSESIVHEVSDEKEKVTKTQVNENRNFPESEKGTKKSENLKKHRVKSIFAENNDIKKYISKKSVLFGLIAAIIIIGVIGKGIITEKIVIPNKQYKTAEQMLNNGKYEDAAKQFEKLGDFRDSSKRVDECYYEKGVEDLTKKYYEQAISSFEKSITYKDSKDKITESYYLWGVDTRENGNLIEASNYFEKCSDYKDSLEQYNECIYNYAKEVVKKSYNYDKAVEYLKKIDYKDSEELVEMYSHFSDGRLFNNRFYWFPEEYRIVINNVFEELDLDVYVDDMKTSEDLCQFTCYSGYSECATILLVGIDNENGYFNKIRLQGYLSNSNIVYPMIAIAGLLVENLQIDTAKEVVMELIDMDPAGSLTKDGVHYTYTNTGGFVVYEVEASGQDADSESL